MRFIKTKGNIQALKAEYPEQFPREMFTTQGQTKPNDSLDLKTIIERYQRGQYVAERKVFYDSNTGVEHPELDKMSLEEIHDYKQAVRDNITLLENKKRLQQAQIKEQKLKIAQQQQAEKLKTENEEGKTQISPE